MRRAKKVPKKNLNEDNWVCQLCGRQFARGWNASRHIKNVHKSNEQPVVLGYYLQGVKTGRYPPPTFHLDKMRRHRTRKKSKKWYEMEFYKDTEMLAKHMDNLQKIRHADAQNLFPFSIPFNGAIIPRYATEFYVGSCCAKCLEVRAIPLPDPYSGSLTFNHVCDQKRLEKVQNTNNIDKQAVVKNIQNGMLSLLKRTVEQWVPGQKKYLMALAMSEDAVKSFRNICPYVRIVPLNEDIGQQHIWRAILASRNNNRIWAPIDDNELQTFLGEMQATIGIYSFEIASVHGGTRLDYYLVRIVPSHLVTENIQRDEEAEWTKIFEQDAASMMPEELEIDDEGFSISPSAAYPEQSRTIVVEAGYHILKEPLRNESSSIDDNKNLSKNMQGGCYYLIIKPKNEQARAWRFTKDPEVVNTGVGVRAIMVEDDAVEPLLSKAKEQMDKVSTIGTIPDFGTLTLESFEMTRIVVKIGGVKLKGLYTLARTRPEDKTWLFYKQEDNSSEEAGQKKNPAAP